MTIQRRTFLAAVGVAGLTAAAGCAGSREPNQPGVVGESLTLTTTTSTHDTGLLGALNGPFEERFGVTVDSVAQGTGAALATARAGDADAVMVHARPLEDAFMWDGVGVNRRALMFNDFVIVGPADDPADIQGTISAVDAFSAMAATEVPFISRGDNSGTHAKERLIWAAAEVDPGGDWYRETGQGMGEVLNVASEQGGYTLADRGTYLSQRSEVALVIMVQGPVEGGPERLANPYGIMAVNPAVHPGVDYDLAMAYIGYVTSRAGQTIIENYTVDGEQLFFPRAISADPAFEQYVPADWRRPPAGD